jgi:hypothetical protein
MDIEHGTFDNQALFLQGFFLWTYGWGLWIDYHKGKSMLNIDIHTLGYLFIALVYIIFAIIK